MNEVSAGPPTKPLTAAERNKRASKRRSDLWSALWEASQDMTIGEIAEYVEDTLREIRSDEE